MQVNSEFSGVQKNEVQVFGTNYISRTYDVGDVQNKD